MGTPNPQPTPPSLASLMSRFLAARVADPSGSVDTCPAVEPHEAPSGFRTDTRTTWTEALVAVHLGTNAAASPTPTPAAWAGISRQLPSRFAVPLCVGNYPQMLGEVSRLFTETDLPSLARPDGTVRAGDPFKLADRARTGSTELSVLLAAGGARLAGQFAEAEVILADSAPSAGEVWSAVWENERTTLLWEQGRFREAIAAWSRLSDGPVKWFNLGMAYLFNGEPAVARGLVTQAATALPETSGWNHLARLYIALCDTAA